jgi:hypothetical protein
MEERQNKSLKQNQKRVNTLVLPCIFKKLVKGEQIFKIYTFRAGSNSCALTKFLLTFF